MKTLVTAATEALILLYRPPDYITSAELLACLHNFDYHPTGDELLGVYYNLWDNDLVDGVVLTSSRERRQLHGDFIITSLGDVLLDETT